MLVMCQFLHRDGRLQVCQGTLNVNKNTQMREDLEVYLKVALTYSDLRIFWGPQASLLVVFDLFLGGQIVKQTRDSTDHYCSKVGIRSQSIEIGACEIQRTLLGHFQQVGILF